MRYLLDFLLDELVLLKSGSLALFANKKIFFILKYFLPLKLPLTDSMNLISQF